MANAYYTAGRTTRAGWIINDNMPAGITLCVVGVDSGYVFSAAHEDLADVGAGNITVPEEEIQNVTAVLGMLDGDNVVAVGLVNDDVIDALIVYFKWAGGESLIAYIDSATDGSLPQTIIGGQTEIHWDASGICRI